TGEDIRQAFQSSGLFLEASLASGSLPPSTDTPDLKAALIVLRQVLTTSLDGATQSSAAVAWPVQQGATPAATVVQQGTTSMAAPAQQGATPAAAVQPQGTTPAAVVLAQGTQPSVQISP